MSKYQYAVLFELQEGGFNVIVPAIPEIRTFGETMQAARVTAKDANHFYLKSAPLGMVSRCAEPAQERIAVSVQYPKSPALPAMHH